MADDATDILMKLELPSGKPMEGESQTDLGQLLFKGGMAQGFVKGSIFELNSFSLKVGTKGGDDVESAKSLSTENNALLSRYHFAMARYRLAKALDENTKENLPEEPTLKTAPSSVDQYAKFRAGNGGKYPVDMNPVEIKKSIDRSSMLLLAKCMDRTVFKSATIIKRKAAGTASAGEIFLRFDFDTVLFTEAELSDGEPLEEKFKFICRAVTMSYRAQKDDGTLDAAVQGFWKTPLSRAKQFNLKG